MKTIRGSGGGGGKGGGGSSRVPKEAADSLQSKAFVQLIDLVGEGEIEGLVAGLRSIYLDGTPLENPDGTYNFTGIDLVTRNGTQDQSYIEGFLTTEKEEAVGVEFTKENSVTRTINNSDVDAVRIRVSLPQLTFQDPKKGDLLGSEVSYSIDLQSNGGGFVEIVRDVIIGKCVSKYERSYRVELTGEPPWDIRCRRITADSVQVNLQNKTFFEAYTEIVDGKLRYPNSALVALKVDASQFRSVPTRGYDLKLLRVRVPTNYNPNTRQYAGEWNGTFYIAWTDNPAWIFYDLITSERYGLGGFIPESHIDKWGLYSIAKYCDELVPNGFGGQEPRFTCNVYLQTQEEAYKVLQDLASVFRGMVYWAQGTVMVAQDSPEDPAILFTPANVVDGMFSYSGSSSKTRHTTALVTWNDPADGYKQKVEYVEDAEAIARYGILDASIAAFGCTSRGQANRVGRWLLYTEQHQTEVVTFRTGLNGASIRPGQIALIADPTRAGTRRGGRIASVSGVTVIVDKLEISNPSQNKLSVMMPDGTVEERQVQSASVLNRRLTLTQAFSQTPPPGSIWMLTSADVEPQAFKIISIAESDDGTHDITAVAHDPRKYDAIENGLKLDPRPISILGVVPESPQNIELTETLYEVNGSVRVKVTISWRPPPGAVSYLVQYTKDSQNSVNLPETSSNDIEILNAEPGIYTARVVAINALGTRSVPATATKEIIGKVLPPASVQNFSLMPMEGIAYLSWDRSSDLDVLIGGSIRIRWTPEIDGPVWRNAVDIVPALAGTASRAQAPLLSGTYMAKFIDSSGIASNEEAIIVTTIPEPLKLNVVEEIDEGEFLGEKSGVAFFEEYEGLAIEADKLIDEIEDIDAVLNWDFAGGVGSSGEYDFDTEVDLGEVFSSKITAHIKAEAVDVADFIDMREDPIDEWADLDGDFIDDVNAELYLMTTEDDPGDEEAVWSEWKRFFVGSYKARAFRFQLRLTSNSPSHNIIVKELKVTIDMPDRVIELPETSTAAEPFNLSYETPFKETPSIGITAKNLSSGDTYEITEESRTGFTIVFKNSSGDPISRTFGGIVKGYGRQAS